MRNRHSPTFRSSTPCQWVNPRPHTDASLRYMKHGPVLPMQSKLGLLARLFGRRA
jgi:hypothetical protein